MQLLTIRAAGFTATVDACAQDGGQLWFLSLLGSQQAVRALWARLVKGETAYLSEDELTSGYPCWLAHEAWGTWRFYDDESKRLEHAFLTALTRALCPGGLLVFIVPQRRLVVSARYLAGHYTRFACYRFPDPEHADFRQVVLLAVKRDGPVGGDSQRQQIEAWAAEQIAELPPAGSAEPLYDLPALPAGPVLFASQFFDPEAAAGEAREHGLWASAALGERLWPAEERPVRPLMPLRRGHLAVLIAAGFLNNILLEADGRRLLVKGRTYKELVPVESGDPEVEIEREVLRTSVVALDLRTGRFEVIQQGSARCETSA